MGKGLNRHISKVNMQMTNKHIKTYHTGLESLFLSPETQRGLPHPYTTGGKLLGVDGKSIVIVNLRGHQHEDKLEKKESRTGQQEDPVTGTKQLRSYCCCCC